MNMTRNTTQTQSTLSLLQEILASYHPRNFAIRLWDGTVWEAERGYSANFTLILQHPGALRKMFLSRSELSLSEAYIYNDIDIVGDIQAIFPLVDYLLSLCWNTAEQLRYGLGLLRLPKRDLSTFSRQIHPLSGERHSKYRDREAVSYHYDRSNDFYQLWLDKRMLYSCAYFSHPNDSLDLAQKQKLETICQKLRLQPGEKLLDIGCGWGGLIIYAAKHYRVKTLGITLSQEQAAFTREHIREEGLEDHCQVEICDYRDVQGTYEKLVSIEMIEHVGEIMCSAYFEQAWKLLAQGGLFLNQSTTRHITTPKLADAGFIKRYVFPDGEFLSIQTILQEAEESRFKIDTIENLQAHYVRTLCHWLSRLEENRTKVKDVIDERTYRIWRLYLAGSIHAFQQGSLNVYQTVFMKREKPC